MRMKRAGLSDVQLCILRAVPASLLSASYRTPLFLVMYPNRWGYPVPGRGWRFPALLLPRHGEPASGYPCCLPAIGSGHRATCSPEGRSRLPTARQLPNAAVLGDVPPPLGVSGTGPG